MQITLRVPEELSVALKKRASARGESVNAYATAVLSAAVDPDLADDEVLRLRERLTRAGLLEDPADSPTARPPVERVREARRRAGRGTQLSDLVREGRT